MSFLGFPLSQARKPLAEVLPDGRKRLTRFFKVNQTASNVPVEIDYPVKTADPGTDTPTGWTGLLLTYKKMRESERGFPDGIQDSKPICELVFEQISPTGETETGGAPFTQLPDGRHQVIFTYVMFSTSAYTPQVPGTNTAPNLGTYYLLTEENTDDGTLRNITRTYQTGGQIGEDDEYLQGSNLLIKTIKSAFDVPATPSGYTLVDAQVDQNLGYPIYAWRFAKGTGEISRQIEYSESSNQGSTGITRTVIRYLVVPGASVQPTSLTGSVLIGSTFQDSDGYRIWTTTWAKGTGLVDEYIATRKDGLREVTDVSLGSKTTPAGVVVRDDYREQDGFKIYTVSCIQTDAGSGTVTSATLTFERYVPFVYPGRAKPYTETLGIVTALNVFLGPPVETLVKASVNVTYGTTSSVGTISDFWNPNDWATERSTWVGAYGRAASRTVPHVGYRSTTSAAVTLVGSGYNATIYGYNLYASTTATLYVTGGPVDPGGSTWTLSAEIEPAFTDTSGVRYFRKTLVSAAIPSQPSLPV